MNSKPILRLAGIGCGARTRTYLGLASRLPQLYSITGAADPIAERIVRLREACGNPPGFRSFANDRELLAEEKFADVVIIGTQDADHMRPCLLAMEKGYDILLEKPIATRVEDILQIERRARELGRKVMVCHVLRYTPFYRKVKDIVVSGMLGDVVSLNATEGVNPWHQAHSFVRGHWAVVEKASPMIVAKSCHDLDIITWLMGRPCIRINSYGSLSHFTPENAPAGAPPRCTDGCPAGDACPYNALLYSTVHRRWLDFVMDGNEAASQEDIVEWLKKSPWGRCVYRVDNTAVDHQVVAMEFAGEATATFTMTAFESGRHIEIFGTHGVLRGGEAIKAATGSDIVIRRHDNNETTLINADAISGGYEGHGGGDIGLVMSLHEEMTKPPGLDLATSVARSIESHIMGFAAEKSRLSKQSIEIPGFLKQFALA